MSIWSSFKAALGFNEVDAHPDFDDVTVPQTISPNLVEFVFWNGMMVLGIWLALTIVLSILTWDSPIIAAFLTLIVLGLMVDSYVVNVPDWYGMIVLNSFTKKRRVIFAGLHLKTWPERMEGRLHAIKREVTATIEAVLSTKNPTQKMKVKILVHAKFDSRRKPPQEDADNFIRFTAMEPEDLQHVLQSEVLQMFLGYYGITPMKKLQKTDEVVRAVIEHNQTNHDRLHFLEHNHGVHIGVVLELNTPDDGTTEMMRTGARADALAEGITVLKKKGDMSQESAEDAALILDPTNDYQRFRIDVRGLENARTISVVAAPGMLPTSIGKGASSTKSTPKTAKGGKK